MLKEELKTKIEKLEKALNSIVTPEFARKKMRETIDSIKLQIENDEAQNLENIRNIEDLIDTLRDVEDTNEQAKEIIEVLQDTLSQLKINQ
jgi:predicted nucleic acid-binding protein